jgi:hypothetical protein
MKNRALRKEFRTFGPRTRTRIIYLDSQERETCGRSSSLNPNKCPHSFLHGDLKDCLPTGDLQYFWHLLSYGSLSVQDAGEMSSTILQDLGRRRGTKVSIAVRLVSSLSYGL